MLHHANLPQDFWAKAVRTIVHVINLSPSTTKGLKVAQELWTRKTPHNDHLRVFGCEAYVMFQNNVETRFQKHKMYFSWLWYRWSVWISLMGP